MASAGGDGVRELTPKTQLVRGKDLQRTDFRPTHMNDRLTQVRVNRSSHTTMQKHGPLGGNSQACAYVGQRLAAKKLALTTTYAHQVLRYLPLTPLRSL